MAKLWERGSSSGPVVQPDQMTREVALRHVIGLLDAAHRNRKATSLPETRKTLERIADRMVALADAPDAQVLATLRPHAWIWEPRAPSEEQAWVLADSLHALWLHTASPEAIAAESKEKLSRIDPENLPELRVALHRAYLVRQRDGAHDRARAAMRAKYLGRAGRVLLFLVIMGWIVAIIANGLRFTVTDTVLTLCALGGAIGGSLSGNRALRIVSKVSETRTFQTWWWVQPVVGAAVGMFVYALLSSGVLEFPGTDRTDDNEAYASWVVYALIAGFSEPFLLSILDRLGGAANRAANEDISTRAPATPRERATDGRDEVSHGTVERLQARTDHDAE